MSQRIPPVLHPNIPLPLLVFLSFESRKCGRAACAGKEMPKGREEAVPLTVSVEAPGEW